MADKSTKDSNEAEKRDWDVFERTVDKMLHTPPKPHESFGRKAKKPPRKRQKDT